MAELSQRFLLTSLPVNQQETRDLSTKVTKDFGAKGWRLVGMVPIGDASALLAFEKPFDE